MTFSIVARRAEGASWGVAVASKFLAVGAVVPAARHGVGALATQAHANLLYREEGLRMLEDGLSAAQTLASLTGADHDRETRQAGVVDRVGGADTFTGADCHAWAGGATGDGVAIQGNILTGPEVVAEMARAWSEGDPAAPLARRLLGALSAGDAAGGDRRGRQSAALLVVAERAGYGGESDVAVDLRVDDSARPVAELARLLELHELYFGRPDPSTLLALSGDLAAEVGELLAEVGHEGADLDSTLASWAGVENYEERLVPGAIDPLVLSKLRDTRV